MRASRLPGAGPLSSGRGDFLRWIFWASSAWRQDAVWALPGPLRSKFYELSLRPEQSWATIVRRHSVEAALSDQGAFLLGDEPRWQRSCPLGEVMAQPRVRGPPLLCRAPPSRAGSRKGDGAGHRWRSPSAPTERTASVSCGAWGGKGYEPPDRCPYGLDVAECFLRAVGKPVGPEFQPVGRSRRDHRHVGCMARQFGAAPPNHRGGAGPCGSQGVDIHERGGRSAVPSGAIDEKEGYLRTGQFSGAFWAW